MLINNDSFKLFKLVEDNERLVKAYFSFLVFSYEEICIYLEKNSLDINDPNNHIKPNMFNLNIIIENFELATRIISNNIFLRLAQNMANTDTAWNFLLNKLKLKHLKEDDQFLNDILLDENDD